MSRLVPRPSAVEEWSDESRLEGRTASGTRTQAMYLGTMATMADAEEVGVWEHCDTVAFSPKLQPLYIHQ